MASAEYLKDEAKRRNTLEHVEFRLHEASEAIAVIGSLNSEGLTMFEAYEIVKSTISVQRTIQSRLDYIGHLKQKPEEF